MSDPFIGEISTFAGSFAPRGWAFCNGQLLPIAQNTALFSLLGTIYGGDGRTTFGVPNLQGRAPAGTGRGPGLTDRRQGQVVGVNTVTLSINNLPPHTHTMRASSSEGDSGDPVGRVPAASEEELLYGSTADTPMGSLGPAGGGGAHNNLQPYLVLNHIIALVGVYPSRS